MMSTTSSEAVTIPLTTEGTEDRGQTPAFLRLAKRVGTDIAYLGAVFASSILGFVIWVTGLSLTLGLLVLVVGIFVWLGTVYAFRGNTWIDRRLAAWVRDEPIEAVYRRPEEPGVLALIRTVTADPQTWKDLGWLVLNSIVGFTLSLAALTTTALAIGYITMPAWWTTVSNPGDQIALMNLGVYTVHSTGTAFLTMGIGLALLPVALLLNRGVAAGHSALAKSMLAPSEAQRLRARVDELAQTRSGAVEAAQSQLERIERDLHDGAQARLVALAMELGMAEEELAANPEAAQETVRHARDEALAAVAELRDLSRGMRPALLEERGLATALEALTERSPLPADVTLIGELDDLPEAVQTAAYFVAAEGLTNAAKHAAATRVRVRAERRDGALTIRIEDNGHGGADSTGSGLAGLRKRVGAIDGTLNVSSPTGGPTVLSAGLPCA